MTPPATRIDDCREAPWIAGSPGSMCHALVVRACQVAGFTPRIRHIADDFATVLVLVGAGQGVSLIPELGLAATRAPGEEPVIAVAGVTLTPLGTRRRTGIACRRGTARHPAVAAFATAIRESAARARPATLGR